MSPCRFVRAAATSAATGGFLLAFVAAASAQPAVVTGTWTNVAGGSWTVGSNWSTNPQYPSGAGAGAIIPSTQTAARTISTTPTTGEPAVVVGSISVTNNTAFANTIS